ncbi:hypothetical protein BOC43_28605 [Burkholderia pseudomallei]|nr:hypothetical protein BOC43_28605 [Burkholderia pseudomallei]
MPVSFLSATQRERYSRYPESLSADELARYFHLDDDDREWIATKRRDSTMPEKRRVGRVTTATRKDS